MTSRQDPYRVLGLVPGASVGEIRSAYRRLAKLNHPDTAGERSLPRFLAIRTAYEELVDGEGRLRSRAWPGRSGGAGPRRPSGTPPSRASRDAWRARRTASATDAGSAGSATRGAAGTDETRAGPAGVRDAGGASASEAGPNARPGPRAKARQGAKDGPSSRSGGRPKSADRRTARPGSTTYDEATQPLDPSWDGGSWYGASSGRYWTLNPREYADPRKHGPGYQERARRASQLEAARRAGVRLSEDGVPGGSGPSAVSTPQPPPPPWASPSASSASPARDSNPDGPAGQRRADRRPTGPGAP